CVDVLVRALAFFEWSRTRLALPSFPTRRSSDLTRTRAGHTPPISSSSVTGQPRAIASSGCASTRAVTSVHEVPPGVLVSTVSPGDRKSTRLNSSHEKISYAGFCLKKKETATVYL